MPCQGLWVGASGLLPGSFQHPESFDLLQRWLWSDAHPDYHSWGFWVKVALLTSRLGLEEIHGTELEEVCARSGLFPSLWVGCPTLPVQGGGISQRLDSCPPKCPQASPWRGPADHNRLGSWRCLMATSASSPVPVASAHYPGQSLAPSKAKWQTHPGSSTYVALLAYVCKCVSL